MCGIAGFVGPWPASLAAAMTTALRHRGPDGSGLWTEPASQIALGHRRLAIIDLSDAAQQPMHSADGRFVISYNGEIYNFRALRDDLASRGVRFRSHSDTEVLLELLAAEGPAALAKLVGIFAFALWDRRERRLLLARDHMGVKPLYYAASDKGVLFASELKALTLCPDVARAIDPGALADHLGFLWTAGSATMLKAVRKLRPGETLTYDSRGLHIERYWRVPIAASNASTAHDAAAELCRRIDQVVSDQMVADVPVGALLSGGIDSSAIVAAMCRAAEPARITTFCASVSRGASSTDNFGGDAAHARLVAAELGVKLIEVPTEADLIAELPGMVWALDEPTADFAALQTLMLARAARENGIKVLLSGVGGDDLFTGYGRHVAGEIYARLDRVPGLRFLAAGLLAGLPPTSLLGRRLQRIGALLALPEEAMLIEAMSYSAVGPARRRALIAPELQAAIADDGIPAPLRRSLIATRGRHPVERFLDLELNAFLPDHNLNYTDKMAMQEGVEVRVPLVDPRLVAYAMRLPRAAKIDLRTTKKVFRAAQAGRLPQAVLTRPKQGFGVPVRSWLIGPARDLLEELTSPAAIRNRGLFDADAVARLKEDFYLRRIDAAFTLFPMMAIELWCRALDAAPYAAGAR